MQENGRTPNDGYNPIGICHRLFNFIMNSFLIRATKRVTLGTTTDSGPARDRDDRSRVLEQTPNEGNVVRPDGPDPSSEILVEFRHTNGGSVKRRSKTPDSEKAMQTRQRKDSRDQGDGNGRGENVNKSKSDVVIKDGANLPGRRHHLLSVASNINKKADDFIRSRKEAMEEI